MTRTEPYVVRNKCAYCALAKHDVDESHYCPVDWDSAEYDDAYCRRVRAECEVAMQRRDIRVAHAWARFNASNGEEWFFPADDWIEPLPDGTTDRDEYSNFIERANAVATRFEGYAEQLERVAMTAKTIHRLAESSADLSAYDFFDRYPDIEETPTSGEIEEARRAITVALVDLIVELASDQAQDDGQDLVKYPHMRLMLTARDLIVGKGRVG